MKIALVGNQNSGKTTLFNALTGMNQKIGNWPGVTVQKKTGIIKNTDYELIDLPGIYSLSPYSSEEEISINFIRKEKIDLIINIVDATCIERSLYLTTELLGLNCNVIIALNMVDMLKKKGISINTKSLEKQLGVNIYEISALKEMGIEELIVGIKEAREYKRKVLRLNEENIKQKMQKFNIDAEEAVVTERYEYISKLKQKVMTKKKKLSKTEFLDKIFLHKIFALPIFIIIMFSIYFLSVGYVGKYTMGVMENIINLFSSIVENILVNLHMPEWTQSLVLDGVIKGAGAVISFVPQLIILFLCISILETTGYMSRVAFLLDNIFRKIGLSGKSLIPFIVGSGCSVPGIMCTKIIENEDEKKMATLLVPFIPCSAKLPIIALFSGYFFKDNSGLVSGSLYFLSMFVIIVSSIAIKKYVFKNTSSTFILELPDYKFPNSKYVLKDVYEKSISFIKRAGSTIFLSSIVVWFLISFGIDLRYGVQIEESILAKIGQKFSFIFVPIVGKNSWEVAVSAFQGLIAKEQVVSSMAIISHNQMFDNGSCFDFFSPISAYAFVVFNLFSAPCFAAISAMRKELGSTKSMIKGIIFQTSLAWVLSSLIFCLGNLI